MSIPARRRLVALIFIACVSILWLILPRDASAQNRRRDREKKIAADAAASPTSIPKANIDEPSRAGPKSEQSRSSPPSSPIVPPQNASRTSYSDHFSLLSQKNIFLRNRPSMSPRSNDYRPSNSGGGPQRAQEESLVLTGIILEVDRPIAFIENQSSGTTQRLTIGDPVAHGTIYDMGLDFLEYQTSDGQVTRVEIGRTFTGDAPAPPPATSAPTSAPATTSAAPGGPDEDDGEDAPPRPPVVAPLPPTPAPGAVDPSKANLSIEEKMKLKRQQELKK